MPDSDEYDFWEADPDRSTEWTHQSRSVVHSGGRRRVGALCAAVLLAVLVALIVRSTSGDDRISTSAGVGVGPGSAAAIAALAPQLTVSAAPEPAAIAPDVAAAAPASSVLRVNLATETGVQFQPVNLATPVAETKRTCAITYTVRRGDYWIAIARASSVKLSALLSANGASAGTPLYPNRSICLPASATLPTATTTATTTVTTTATTRATTTASKSTPTTVKPTATTTKAASSPAATTTPTTAAPTTTTPPPPAITYTRAQVEQIIRNVWPDDLEDEAVRIATRESNLIPSVRNSCCYGLFQIYFNANKSSLQSWGIVSASQLYDPQTNAYAAFAMYLRAGGWGPWSL